MAWWLDVLHRAYVWRSKIGLEEIFGRWHSFVTTDLLYDSYLEYAGKTRDRRHLDRERFGQFMVRMGGKPQRPRTSVLTGEHIADVPDAFGYTKRKAEPIYAGNRPRGYELGQLEVVRNAFCAATKLVIEWKHDDEDAE